jgi:hypothetical protein
MSRRPYGRPVERDRRTFVVHVYSTDRCTVQDVRTGVSSGVEALDDVGARIGELLRASGDGTGADRSSHLVTGEDAGLES